MTLLYGGRAVSYTHLDVYKRQPAGCSVRTLGCPTRLSLIHISCEDGGCPINQQIPEYLKLTAAGEFAKAFDIIALDNTSPTINGQLCAEPCRAHCTRLDYESSIDIRRVKLEACDGAQEEYISATAAPPLRTDGKVAIIGAGPAGIGAAIFLRRNGMDVEVFEKLDGPYGIVKYIIPNLSLIHI